MTEAFNIVRARLNLGLSIRGAAREMGIAEQSLRRLEAGDAVTPAIAKKVADFYGIQVTDLAPFIEMAA